MSSIVADLIFSISSVSAGDITNGYDSVLLKPTDGTQRGKSPGDPCYEVGEKLSTNSKTYILLVL